MAELSNRELDALVAEKVMGWTLNQPQVEGWERWWVDGNQHSMQPKSWDPSRNRNAAAQVLERIGELGAWNLFSQALYPQIQQPPEASKYLDFLHALMWDCITATPRQLMLAALKATEDER